CSVCWINGTRNTLHVALAQLRSIKHVNVKVLLFATLKDRAQRSQVSLALADDATVGDLKTRLAVEMPSLAPLLAASLVSVNREFAFAQAAVHDGDEVALFPPVSGGGPGPADFPTLFRITNDPLDLDALVAAITLPTTGAACVFSGMVRGQTARAGDPLGP